MFKLLKLMFFLIFVTNCSIDTKTGIWENKKEISSRTFSTILTSGESKLRRNGRRKGSNPELPSGKSSASRYVK